MTSTRPTCVHAAMAKPGLWMRDDGEANFSEAVTPASTRSVDLLNRRGLATFLVLQPTAFDHHPSSNLVPHLRVGDDGEEDGAAGYVAE